MILQLFRRTSQDAKIERLYGTIVAQARHPALYETLGVPDTLEGRFEAIVLHCVLMLRRLRRADGALDAVGQALFDRFCTDMDHSLREIGVSDLGVPRQMRRMGEAFYGRATVYDQALDAADRAALCAALARNVLGGETRTAAADGLADYVLRSETALAAQEDGALASGDVAFPDPGASAVKEASHGG
jgi:cytochrome b pre-mRNA-processing protein 3